MSEVVVSDEVSLAPAGFAALLAGLPPHLVLTDCGERVFNADEVLRVRERREDGTFTGAEAFVRVLYATHGPDWGLSLDVCVMSVQVLARTGRPPSGRYRATLSPIRGS